MNLRFVFGFLFNYIIRGLRFMGLFGLPIAMPKIKKKCAVLEYEDGELRIYQLLSSEESSMNNKGIPCTLDIEFGVDILDQYWFFGKPATHSKSLHVKLSHSTYTSYDNFYRVMKDNLDENWGEEFVKNYRHVVIRDMIGKIHEIIDDECNKGRRHLDFKVLLVLDLDSPPLEREVTDFESALKEDCSICLEELGVMREKMLMPCSHMLHRDCFTTWLKHGYVCPVCRYDLRPTLFMSNLGIEFKLQ